MPAPGLVSGSIITSSTSKTPQMVQIAQAVELGLYQWFILPTTFISGVGVGQPTPAPAPPPPPTFVGPPPPGPVMTGTLSVLPNAGIMEASFKGNGLVGVMAPVMWIPIMLGVSKPYPIIGPSTLVGVGGFTGVLAGDPASLISLLVGSFNSVGIVGLETPRICNALGQGIFGMFSTSAAVGAIAGPVVPPPVPPVSAPVTGRFL